MKRLIWIFALLLSSTIFANDVSKDFIPTGSLKTQNYLIELGNQDKKTVYRVKNLSDQKRSGIMNEQEFLASYPKLYDALFNSVADDASLFPLNFENGSRRDY